VQAQAFGHCSSSSTDGCTLRSLFLAIGEIAHRWREEEVYEFSYAGFDNFDFFPAGWNLRWLFHMSRFIAHFPVDAVRTALLLHRIRPALVHINAGQAVTFGLTARLMGYPVVWHVRELVVRNLFGGLLDRLYRFCSRCIIAPSKGCSSRLPRCASKLLIIPNGVRIPSPREALEDEFRRLWGSAKVISSCFSWGTSSIC